jgi:hypothetical protein
VLAVAAALLMISPAAGAASPTNDNFSAAEDLGNGTTTSVSGTNVDATKELGEPRHAGDPGGASVWYRWTAPASGEVRIDTCQSDFDTLLGVYTGSAVNALSEIASNDQACGNQSKVIFNATTGTTYRIAVDGWRGPVPAFPAEGNVELRIQPVIRPANDNFANAQDLGNGATATISGTNVDASKEIGEPDHAADPGGSSVWYRWTAPASGPVRISTCTSDFDTLLAVYTGVAVGSLTEVASNDQGCDTNQSRVLFSAIAGVTYMIAVDGYSAGGAAQAQEGALSLDLRPPSPPVNDNFANATNLGSSLDVSITGSNLDASKEAGEPNHAGDPGGASVWYRWTSLSLGRVKINLCDSGFDTLLAVYTGSSVNNLTQVVSSDQACNNQSKVAFDVLPGVTYMIAVDGWSDNGANPPAQGRIDLNLKEVTPPANDNFANAINLGSVSQATFGVNTFDATKESGEPNHGGDPGGASAWYRWTAPSSGPVRLNTCGSFFGFDTLLGVYTGAGVNALSTVSGNNDACAFGLSRLIFMANAGTTYYFAIDGSSQNGTQAADEGLVNVDLKVLDPPANDNFSNAVNLGSSPNVSVSGDNIEATKESGEPYAYIDSNDPEYDDIGGSSVWYRWTAPTSDRYMVELCDSNFDTLLAIFTGSTLNGLTRIANSATGCNQTDRQALQVINATAGTTYQIMVDGWTFGFRQPPDEGSIELKIYPAGPATQVPLPPSGGGGSGTPVTTPGNSPSPTCKKGFKRKKVQGKVRCVKKRKGQK